MNTTPSTSALTTAGRSHIGLIRRRNEDALYLGKHLLAVADGLGGHVAGDVASSTAIDALRPYDQPVDPADLVGTLARAVHTTNGALHRRITRDASLAGMGTTLVAVLWSGSSAALANLGDSRAYLLHRADEGAARTVQITEDHVYKHLVSDSARVPNLPDKLARFIDGRTDGRSPDITSITFQPGDRLLLCSDGLSSYVPHEKIHHVLATSVTADGAVEDLISLALAWGGHDNVTVAVIDA